MAFRPNQRPFTYRLSTANPRVRILYPNFREELNEIDVFVPPQTGEASFTLQDEAQRGEITAFTPGMANEEDGLETVNGNPLDSVDPPYNPSSALEPEYPGYDELVKPEGAAPAPKNTPETTQVLQDIEEGFPNVPSPDTRLKKKRNT